MGKRSGHRANIPLFESCLCSLLTVGPWGRSLTVFGLYFSVCRMAMMTGTSEIVLRISNCNSVWHIVNTQMLAVTINAPNPPRLFLLTLSHSPFLLLTRFHHPLPWEFLRKKYLSCSPYQGAPSPVEVNSFVFLNFNSSLHLNVAFSQGKTQPPEI